MKMQQRKPHYTKEDDERKKKHELRLTQEILLFTPNSDRMSFLHALIQNDMRKKIETN